MTPEGFDPQSIRKNGWGQGAALQSSLVERLHANNELPVDEGQASVIFIVVSHDCDIVYHCLEAEPWVEVAAAHVLSDKDKDGNVFWGKSPRRYQLIDEGRNLEFSIHRTHKIRREYLCESASDENARLSKESILRLCSWIGRRYTRASFPDAFNERTRGVAGSLRKTFKKRGHLLTGIYILVSDEELAERSDYEIIIWTTMRSKDYSDTKQRKEAQRLTDEIEAAMAGCDGIDVKACELRSEDEVSLSDLRLLKRWDFDDLSLRDESVSDLAPQAG